MPFIGSVSDGTRFARRSAFFIELGLQRGLACVFCLYGTFPLFESSGSEEGHPSPLGQVRLHLLLSPIQCHYWAHSGLHTRQSAVGAKGDWRADFGAGTRIWLV
jgi:hypothetical protein